MTQQIVGKKQPNPELEEELDEAMMNMSLMKMMMILTILMKKMNLMTNQSV